jgi:hypothetical protein
VLSSLRSREVTLAWSEPTVDWRAPIRSLWELTVEPVAELA